MLRTQSRQYPPSVSIHPVLVGHNKIIKKASYISYQKLPKHSKFVISQCLIRTSQISDQYTTLNHAP